MATVDGPALRVDRMKGRGWPGDLFAGLQQYRVLGGCACVLLADDPDDEAASQRKLVLAELEAYLAAATEQGPVRALVCWAGDERKAPEHSEVTVAGFGAFDFGSAWDVPTRLVITRG
ncbi:MAG: hypothetical protein QOK06_3348 [Acidimicrobiaceae bacterium]|jgi:hypothetical protein